jgi:formylglycine-generating enzyme required for sulfatase activity
MTGAPRPAGSVPYAYRIGKYEISEAMIDKANAEGGLGLTKDTRGPDKPATSIDWFEAAKFVNWLNTSTGHTPAYKFNGSGSFQLWIPSDAGYDPNNLFRNQLARYFLPSMDEWYKAAYYDPLAGVYWDYPIGSNLPPTAVASGTAAGTAVFHQGLSAGPADILQAGGLSPYRTMGQGGNVEEWEETSFNLLNDNPVDTRGRRGGAWETLASTFSSSTRFDGSPSIALSATGIRIASIVPEPSSFVLIVSWTACVLGLRKRRSDEPRIHAH